MRYSFLIDGKEHIVTVEEHADGPKFIVDGETFEPQVTMKDGRYVSKVDGDDFPFQFETSQVHMGNQVLDVEVRRAKPQLIRAGGKSRRGSGDIKPPMPGKVVDIHVREGDQVAEGDPLLVLEAMKMQNELKAPIAGVIKSVKVKPGQNVESTTILIEITPEEA